jgi:hypothetical protein
LGNGGSEDQDGDVTHRLKKRSAVQQPKHVVVKENSSGLLFHCVCNGANLILPIPAYVAPKRSIIDAAARPAD